MEEDPTAMIGRIAAPEAETALIDAFAKLKDYWDYVGWYSDHPALYACHSSPLHARIIEALDAIGSTRAARIAPHLIRSVPTDPDRALFPGNDDYETLVGRVLLRSGRGDAVVETCLELLGDRKAADARDPRRNEDLRQAVGTTFAAWAGKPAPDNRAAQILSAVCRDQRYEPRVRAAYERYRSKPEDPVLRDKIFHLKQQFLIDQPRHVRQQAGHLTAFPPSASSQVLDSKPRSSFLTLRHRTRCIRHQRSAGA